MQLSISLSFFFNNYRKTIVIQGKERKQGNVI